MLRLTGICERNQGTKSSQCSRIHRLGGQLRGQDAEPLLDGDSVPGELVVGGEARRVGALGDDALDGLLLSV